MNQDKPLVPQGPALVAPPPARLVAATLVLGFLCNLLPWPDSVRWLVPDCTLVVLLYWNIHAPHIARLGLAFVMGLLVDAAQGALIGQHALAYVLTAFIALSLRRRLENFEVGGRAIHLAPLFLAEVGLVLLLGLLFNARAVDARYLVSGVSALLVWVPMAYGLDRLIGWSNVMHIEPAEEKS